MRATYNLYSTKFYNRDQIEGEVSQIWRVEKCAQNLFINYEGWPLRRFRQRWEDNIKMDLKVIGC